MDELFKTIIKKTELKNWTLFLFIFAICYIFWLHSIEGKWFAVPKTEYPNTTLFLLEVFLSSLTITRILVAIKFLEAINRTPIIADIINWVVVERKSLIVYYELFIYAKTITGKTQGGPLGWTLTYKDIVTEKEGWILIHFKIIMDGTLPHYNNLKKAIDNKMQSECVGKVEIGTNVSFTLNPAIHRHLDTEKYGFWIPKRPFCLEHIIFGGVVIPLLYYGAFYVHYLLLYLCDIILKWI